MVVLDAHVTVLLSGRLGFATSSPLDCHVYLLRAADTNVLIDTGAGAGGLERALAQAGCPARSLNAALLTHAHADHAGGAAGLASMGVPVWGGSLTSRLLGDADEEATGLRTARTVGVYPPDYHLAPAAVHPLTEDTVRVGNLEFGVVATPGHCADHQSYWIDIAGRRLLFSGDAVFYGGHLLLQALDDVSVAASAESCRRLAALGCDGLLPGHGMLALSGGAQHLAAAVRAFDHGRVPPNLPII